MKNQTEQLPPHSVEAEQCLLGCCLLDAKFIDECQAKFGVNFKAFYDERHKLIYRIICELHAKGSAVEPVLIYNELKNNNKVDDAGGLAYLSSLPEFVSSTENFKDYFAIVWDNHLLRKVGNYCAKAQVRIREQNVNPQSLIGEIQNGFATLEADDSKTSGGKECVLGLNQDLERRYELKQAGKHSGLLTGFTKLDHMTDGLQLGEMTIIGARPSVGKTALGLNIVSRVCLHDEVPTAIITLEMSRDALMRRMLSDHCSIPMNQVRNGTVGNDYQDYLNFGLLVSQRPLFIVDGSSGGMDIGQLSAEVRRLVRKHGVNLVVVDYLQMIRPTRSQEKRTYEVAEASIGVKALARENKIAVVALAQLNRESEKDKGRKPRLADLGDSKQIEQDGDLICLLHRDRDPQKAHIAELGVAKQRDGETGTISLLFHGQFCRFENESAPV